MGAPSHLALIDPEGIAADRSGNLFIADGRNNRVRCVDAATGIITMVAGDGSAVFNGDAIPAASAGLRPTAVAVDDAGHLFILDVQNLRVRKVDPATGLVTTVAGNGSSCLARATSSSPRVESPGGSGAARGDSACWKLQDSPR